MTGATFRGREIRTFVVCTNEGNADFIGQSQKLNIASIGIRSHSGPGAFGGVRRLLSRVP